MASPDIIDLDSLLLPISEESPSGEDVRENASPTSSYQQIKLERNQARAAERQSIDGNDQESYDHWVKIMELAPKIIKEESKDIEIASWYTEAMVRIHGFAGLRDAFRLIKALVDNFWDGLHPMPDEFGMETRVSCLAGLNGEGAEGVLISPIRKVFLTEGYAPAPFGLWQYFQALDAQKIKDDAAKKKKIDTMGFSLGDIEKAIEETSENFLVNTREDINTAIEEYKTLGLQLDELCGLDDSPSTKAIIEVLEDCVGAVNHLGRAKFPSDAEEVEGAETEEIETSEDGVTETKKVVVKGPVASREDAFKQLQEIATFFRKTEPHSPVSYVLEKAVKWGNMPLNELISELITDPGQKERFGELTGVSYEEQ